MVSAPTPQGSVRQRNVGSSSKKTSAAADSASDVDLDAMVKAKATAAKGSSERDYKVTLAFITALGFLTRFWGISHPNEVVFDEVHFGKVCGARLWILSL
jgi:dolichyl-phosphate-mannose-protein mannosyltransferase